MKHGIRIEERETKRLVHFIECREGAQALRVLAGVRMNMDSKKYRATEGFTE